MNRISSYIQTLALLLLLTGFQTISLFAQLSPGDLAKAHAHLEGMSNCVKCHVLRKQVSNEKCLDCHREIASRIEANRGYHVSVEVKGKECASCHNDHHGRNFEMIRFDRDRFGHSLTGYTLQGAHGRIGCSQCHKKEFIGDPELRERTDTYLGLGQACKDCHEDYHQGDLGVNCSSCHGYEHFRPAPGFNHNNSAFRLAGKHQSVDCAACHRTTTRNGRETRIFRGGAHGNCTDCHRDVHENRFGQDCNKCHTELSFKQIKNAGDFDHAATGFPLKGKHESLSCTSCHKNGYSGTLKHSRCADCHTDCHRKQFTTVSSVPDCAECHSEQGFSPSLFTIQRHNSLPFALDGAHRATPCFDCHRKDERWEFREIGKTCSDCHQDIHAGVLDSKYYPDKQCTACHQDSRWSDISFDHALTGYLLEGAHRNQSCRACHMSTGEQVSPVQKFSRLSSDCLEYHREVHNRQFGTLGISCLKCHDYFDWKVGLFDHSLTAFPLDGKHRDVDCAKCHPQVTEGDLIYTRYKPISTTCESCH
ncbi:MAG: cytochrome c3 family protein [Bacteroidales bacterium]|nr:cytochrome c3 family protein [Bacteroidales bacterium]